MLMKKCPKCCATVENEAEVCSNCGNVFPENRPFSKAGIAGFICSVSALASVPTAIFSYFVMMISDSARSVRFFLIQYCSSYLLSFGIYLLAQRP